MSPRSQAWRTDDRTGGIAQLVEKCVQDWWQARTDRLSSSAGDGFTKAQAAYGAGQTAACK
ncbi:hypothetical protein Amsp01_088930 [Amycolatopsis sp. NBRC 101858]|nr:hypothetical protein Amsp01_088930 [Amycolatopsis sp. NBRC 101858]